MTRRLSRGTPYVLTTADVENVIGALTPRMEEQVASLMEMTVDDWRALPKPKRAKHIVDFQNRAALANALAASAKAHTDLEAAAFAVTQQTQANSIVDDLKALQQLVHDRLDSEKNAGRK